MNNQEEKPHRGILSKNIPDFDYKSMIEQTGILLIQTMPDDDATLSFATPSWYAFTGYSAEEFQLEFHNQYAAIIAPEDREKLTLRQEALLSARPFEATYHLVCKNGKKKQVHDDMHPISNPGGKLYGCSFLTKAAFTREREHVLRNTRHHIESLLSAMNGFIIITAQDEIHTLLYSSSQLFQFLGYSREEFPKEFPAGMLTLILKEDFQKINALYQKNNEIDSISSANVRMRKKDGSIVWVLFSTRHIKYRGQPALLSFVLDTTTQAQTIQELKSERELYRVAIKSANEVLFEYDIEADTFHSYKAVQTSLGLKVAHYQIQNYAKRLMRDELVHPDDRGRILPLLLGDVSNTVEVRMALPSQKGRYSWRRILCTVIYNRQNDPIRAIGTIRDISEEKAKEEQLLEQAMHDHLTGLYNKSATKLYIEQYLELNKKKQPSCLMIIDLDNFKSVNDNLGHLFGDVVLQNVAKGLKKIFCDYDIIGRIGGDEFVVFLKQTSEETACKKASDVCSMIKELYSGEQEQTNISCSIGLAISPRCGTTFEMLFQRADTALYHAKRNGKNQNENYNPNTDYVSANILGDPINQPTANITEFKAESQNQILSFALDLLETTKDLHSAIQLLLGRIGETFDLDRVIILDGTVKDGNYQGKETFSWTRQNPALPANDFLYQNHISFPFADFMGIEKRYIAIEDTKKIVSSRTMKNFYQQRHIQSILICSMYESGDMLGSIVYVSKLKKHKWQESEVSFLRELTQIISSYLLRLQIASIADGQMRALMNTDKLTGLPSLTKFIENVKVVLSEHPQQHFAIVYSNLSNFKYINENYGYAQGDRVLCDFAELLRMTVEFPGCLARVTSDHFVYLLKAQNENLLIQWVQKSNQAFSTAQNALFPVSNLLVISGAYFLTSINEDIWRAVDNANIAWKTIEHIAQTNCVIFNENMQRRLTLEMEMSNNMVSALAGGEFIIYLQPKVLLSDESICGTEALVRWKRASGEIILPDQFVPFFEKNGFIMQLDFYVYEQVLKMMQRQIKQGKKLLPISINFSRRHQEYEDTVKNIYELACQYQVPTSLLEIELTESIFINQTDNLQEFIQRLLNYGFQVSIDDFGSGYSSLSLLGTVPVSIIKLDKVFLSKTGVNKARLTQNIVSMIKNLGCKVVAEGVETREQMDFLKSIGCDIGQGYYFSRPIAMEDYENQ